MRRASAGTFHFLLITPELAAAEITCYAGSAAKIEHRAQARKNVRLKATEQPIDTSNAAGRAFLDMLGAFAEFETNLRRERQMEGIHTAKARASTRTDRRSNWRRGVASMDKDDLARLALFASVMSIAPDGIISVDEEQLIISFNEGAQKTFGYRRDEIMGRPLGSSCCQSGFEPLTPGTSANLPHRVQRRGSWVSDRKSLACIRTDTSSPQRLRSVSWNWTTTGLHSSDSRDITDASGARCMLKY